MTTHGGGFARAGSVGNPLACHYAPRCPANPSLQGFRHFLRDPGPEERFKINGTDPITSPTGQADVRAMMSGVARLLEYSYEWPPPPAAGPTMPSGYTYLLQFIAHDLVQTSLPVSTLQGPWVGVRNNRSVRLMLDTLYGLGPDDSPLAYAVKDVPHRTRTRLRLGQMGNAGGYGPPRDIARVAAPHVTGAEMKGTTEALIADARNDDHAILSQLTTLLIWLHNGIVGLLEQPAATMPNIEQDAYFRFLCARRATTIIYHSIIRNDVLKRLLDPEVYDRYVRPNASFLDDAADALPLEFSHGAFRFGHAMVRDSYAINAASAEDPLSLTEALQRSSSRQAARLPLDAAWIAQWSHFFELGATEPNRSRPIGPHFSSALIKLPMFGPIDDSGWWGIGYRDLVSAGLLGMWSVKALATELVARGVPQPAGALLFDPAARAAAIKGWLHALQAKSNLTDAAIESLAEDPPLPLYVLIEAAYEQGGLRLGTLGSIIVAETVFGALRDAEIPGGAAPGELGKALAALSRSIYGADCLRDFQEIANVAEMISFVAQASAGELAAPAFI